MTRVSIADDDVGRSCPYCRFPLKQAIEAEQCDVCGALHHEDCWSDGDGCAVFGCTGAASSGDDAGITPPADGSHDPLPTVADRSRVAVDVPGGKQRPAPPPPPPPPPAADRRRLIAVGVGLLVAAAGVGGYMLSSAGSDDKPTAAAPAPPVSTATTVAATATQVDAPDPAAADRAGARQIARIIRFSQAGRAAVREQRYDDAVANRQTVLRRLHKVRGLSDDLERPRQTLLRAMEASLAADEVYAAGGQPTADDAEATERKRQFIGEWNPIADELGFRTYAEGEF